MPYLELIDIKKYFTTKSSGLFTSSKEVVKAVDGVSLSIEEGKILGLVGESGCGKSTLSRLIMQLIEPTEGSIVLKGENLTSCLLYTSPSPRDATLSRMPSSA